MQLDSLSNAASETHNSIKREGFWRAPSSLKFVSDRLRMQSFPNET